MFIRLLDEAMEKLLRDALPLPPHLGEISFDPPTSGWAAQLSRLTVNLFLYDVARSPQPTRAPTIRTGADGRPERRLPLPMVQLSYLVSAWAGSPRDEHQLLGDVVNRLVARSTLDPDYLPAQTASTVDISFGNDPANKTREIWGALGGQLKASFTLQLAVAADAFDWTEQAPPVQRIEALTAPLPIHRSITR
jgi:hypothetical protein